MQVTQHSVTLVLCQVALFLVLFVILKRLWFKPVAAVLQERERRSEGALAEARAMHVRVEELRAQHAKALEQARLEARHEVQELWRAAETEQQRLIDEAQTEAERTLVVARAEIAGDIARARQELETQVREIARQAAQSVLGRVVG
jgi:F-type H+-transporting ATPase subunit b